MHPKFFSTMRRTLSFFLLMPREFLFVRAGFHQRGWTPGFFLKSNVSRLSTKTVPVVAFCPEGSGRPTRGVPAWFRHRIPPQMMCFEVSIDVKHSAAASRSHRRHTNFAHGENGMACAPNRAYGHDPFAEISVVPWAPARHVFFRPSPPHMPRIPPSASRATQQAMQLAM